MAMSVAADEPECAATRAPNRWAASITAFISSGVISAFDISPPSVAMPPEIKIFTQEAPALISRRAAFMSS